MIAIVTGSVRPGNVSEVLAEAVLGVCQAHGIEARIVNLRQLDLPFVNSPLPPSSPDFEITDQRVRTWFDTVADSDGLVFLTPTYNAQPSAVIKNAIDWLYEPWRDKRVAVIGYGWHEGAESEPLLEQLLQQVNATVVAPVVHLQFTKDLASDGAVLDAMALQKKLTTLMEKLRRAV